MATKMTVEMANKRVEELEKQMSEVMERLGMTMKASKKEDKPERQKRSVE